MTTDYKKEIQQLKKQVAALSKDKARLDKLESLSCDSKWYWKITHNSQCTWVDRNCTSGFKTLREAIDNYVGE